jgi:hypothetical protein
MGKVIFWVFAGLLGLVILGSLVGKDESTRNPDERSVGYLSPGECMSPEKYNWAASIVVKNTDWSQMEESAAYSAGTKSLIGGITVFKEMARLGEGVSGSCAALQPIPSLTVIDRRGGQASAVTSCGAISAGHIAEEGDADDRSKRPEWALDIFVSGAGCEQGRHIQRIRCQRWLGASGSREGRGMGCCEPA